MLIANKLRNTNRAEYLLYMWQVEDLLRANGCDMDRLRANYLSRFQWASDTQRAEVEQWYADLIDMMHGEGVVNGGHLQINKNVVTTLTELHQRLLHSAKYPYYNATYYKALPSIVELRSRGADCSLPELETCFDALYGVMLLRLQKKTVTPETERAVKDISTLLGMLSDYYKKDQKEPLEF